MLKFKHFWFMMIFFITICISFPVQASSLNSIGGKKAGTQPLEMSEDIVSWDSHIYSTSLKSAAVVNKLGMSHYAYGGSFVSGASEQVTANPVSSDTLSFGDIINVDEEISWIRLWTGNQVDGRYIGSYVNTSSFNIYGNGWIEVNDLDNLKLDFAQYDNTILYILPWASGTRFDWQKFEVNFQASDQVRNSVNLDITQDTYASEIFKVENIQHGQHWLQLWIGGYLDTSAFNIYGDGWIEASDLSRLVIQGDAFRGKESLWVRQYSETLDPDSWVDYGWLEFKRVTCILTMQVNPTGGGTTTPSVGTHTYKAGTEVTITAHPNPGYRFVNWTGGPVANPNSAVTTVTMNGDRTVTANFVVADVRPVHNITKGTFYHTIQAGINASRPGDVIVVSPGTYQENIVLDGKSITLRSSDHADPAVVASTVIDGAGIDDVIRFQGAGVSILQGFTIRNGLRGIWVSDSATVTITNNTITGNEKIGIQVDHSSTATITNNTITGNERHGIGVAYSSIATITDNTITGNEMDGISVLSAEATITDNTITGNEMHGISVIGVGTATITNNTITGNEESGIKVSVTSTATITDNTITGNEESGIVITWSTAEITNNTITGNGVRGIEVSLSATATITNNRITGNEESGIAVGGGDEPHHDSNATITDNTIEGNGWNGIAVGGSTVTITDNEITGNGFIGIVLTLSADATITNNRITGNEMIGIHVLHSSTADIRDNTITGNEFLGIGISHSSTATITNNTIEENREHGIAVVFGSTATITRNTITRNRESGIWIHGSTATITGNTINHHEDGGVVGSEFLPGWPHAVPCWTCFACPCPSIPDDEECDPEDLIFCAPAGTYTFNGNTFLGNTIGGEYQEGAHIR